MVSTTAEGKRRIEFYTRGELPEPAAKQVATVHDRLRQLENRGELDSVVHREWVGRVPVGDCEGWLRDTYLEFTGWADRKGVQLTPFFSIRECYTPGREEYTDWLVLPALCVALYEDNTLQAVYPHADGDETRTVEDALDSIEHQSTEFVEQSPTAAD